MLLEIIYFQILGKPLMMWLGVLTIFLFLATFSIPFLRRKWPKLPIGLHFKLAWITLIFAIIHGFLAIMVYF